MFIITSISNTCIQIHISLYIFAIFRHNVTTRKLSKLEIIKCRKILKDHIRSGMHGIDSLWICIDKCITLCIYWLIVTVIEVGDGHMC